MAARRSTSRRSPQFYAKTSGPLTRESLHETLTAAEPAYRAYLDANTGGTLWSLKGIEGPTENGETLVTWTSPNGGALVLYAIAVTEKLVEVRLFAGAEQPRGKRVPVDVLGKPGVVLASLLQAYVGRVPWARENPMGSYPRPLRNPVVRRHATSNPLDTAVDGWTHWHGNPPDEVGNLGPGQQIQTADGWWYRQDTGPDAGKLYFQAAGGMLAPVETVEYVETEIPLETFPIDSVDAAGLAQLPPLGELPMLAVENPRGHHFPRSNPGLTPTDRIDIVPGNVYAMGARRALIVVDRVSDEQIDYHNFSKSNLRSQSSLTIQRWIGEDLIAQGERSFVSNYGVSPNRWARMTDDEKDRLVQIVFRQRPRAEDLP